MFDYLVARRRDAMAGLIALLFSAAAYGAEPLTVDAAIARALAANPVLASARARAESRAALPSQAGTLPDPTLTIEPGRAAMNQLKISLNQALPYPGKLKLQQEIAKYDAEAADLEAREAVLQLGSQVKQAWWQLFYIDRALVTVHHTKELLRQLASAAESRYRVGEGVMQDVLRAQLELSKLMAAEVDLAGQRRGAEARFNTLLYRPVATPLVLPAAVTESLPELPSEEELSRLAMSRPMLLARLRGLEAAKSTLALAHKDYRPDLMVGASYERREGEADMKSVMFTLTLPLHTAARQDKAVDQRRAELMAQRFAQQEAEAQVAAEVAVALADYRRAHEQAQLLKMAIIPQANQTVTSMRMGYQVGKVDFFNLSDAQSTLYDYETRYWQAFSEAQRALAQLEAAVGQEVVHE